MTRKEYTVGCMPPMTLVHYSYSLEDIAGMFPQFGFGDWSGGLSPAFPAPVALPKWEIAKTSKCWHCKLFSDDLFVWEREMDETGWPKQRELYYLDRATFHPRHYPGFCQWSLHGPVMDLVVPDEVGRVWTFNGSPIFAMLWTDYTNVNLIKMPDKDAPECIYWTVWAGEWVDQYTCDNSPLQDIYERVRAKRDAGHHNYMETWVAYDGGGRFCDWKPLEK